MLYAAVAQIGSDPSTTHQSRGAGEEGRTIPSNITATKQQWAWDRHGTLRQGTEGQSPHLRGEPQGRLQVDGGGRRTLCCWQNRIICSAALHCSLCSVFSGDYQLTFTSLFGFKESFLQVSFVIYRKPEKHELKNHEMKKESSQCLSNSRCFRELSLQRMGGTQVPLCTAAGCRKSSSPAQGQEDGAAWQQGRQTLLDGG